MDPKKSETMCLAFNCDCTELLSPIILNKSCLPWVSRAKHIGNFLQEDGTTSYDLTVKRGIFIQTALELNQEFSSLPSAIKMRLGHLYNSHFSGSCIWKLESEEASHLFASWNKNIKLIYKLPWATHRWILEEITGCNLKVMLSARFIKFVNGIMKSNKPAIKFLLSVMMNDVRSTTGSNMRSIQRHTGVQVLPGTTKVSAIKNFRMHPVPRDQEWKVPLLMSILAIQDEEWEIPFCDGDDADELPKAILQDICAG